MKINFTGRVIKINGASFIRIPNDASKGLAEGDEVIVSAATKFSMNGSDIEIKKKMELPGKVHEWMVGRSSNNPDKAAVVSPRTISMNFGITVQEAIVILSSLEDEGKVKSEENSTGMVYRLA